MKPEKAYKYCLLCGQHLLSEGKDVLLCSVCHHRHYLNPLPANAAIIENDQGEILLVRRAKDPKKGYWDLPGGFIQPGEDFIFSLQREVQEELGCAIEVGQIIGAYPDIYTYQSIDLPTLAIVAIASLKDQTIVPADDVDGYQFFPKASILEQKIAFLSIKQAIKDFLSLRERGCLQVKKHSFCKPKNTH